MTCSLFSFSWLANQFNFSLINLSLFELSSIKSFSLWIFLWKLSIELLISPHLTSRISNSFWIYLMSCWYWFHFYCFGSISTSIFIFRSFNGFAFSSICFSNSQHFVWIVSSWVWISWNKFSSSGSLVLYSSTWEVNRSNSDWVFSIYFFSCISSELVSLIFVCFSRCSRSNLFKIAWISVT